MKDISIFLTHILEQTKVIQEISAQITCEGLKENVIFLNAMSRSFEIIGEAAKHIPQEFRDQHPDIAWRGMAGFRDKLIHSYFSIDIQYLWELATETIPVLQKQIEALLSD